METKWYMGSSAQALKLKAGHTGRVLRSTIIPPSAFSVSHRPTKRLLFVLSLCSLGGDDNTTKKNPVESFFEHKHSLRGLDRGTIDTRTFLSPAPKPTHVGAREKNTVANTLATRTLQA